MHSACRVEYEDELRLNVYEQRETSNACIRFINLVERSTAPVEMNEKLNAVHLTIGMDG